MNSNAQTPGLFSSREKGPFLRLRTDSIGGCGEIRPVPKTMIARLPFQHRNRSCLDAATEIVVFRRQLLAAWDLLAELVDHQRSDLIDSAKALKCQPVGASDFVAITGQGKPEARSTSLSRAVFLRSFGHRANRIRPCAPRQFRYLPLAGLFAASKPGDPAHLTFHGHQPRVLWLGKLFPSPSNSCPSNDLCCGAFRFQGLTEGGVRCVLPSASR